MAVFVAVYGSLKYGSYGDFESLHGFLEKITSELLDPDDIIQAAAAMDQVRPPLDPSCAICGRPPYPECPHEGESLQRALQQAQDRWTGVQRIR